MEQLSLNWQTLLTFGALICAVFTAGLSVTFFLWNLEKKQREEFSKKLDEIKKDLTEDCSTC